MRSKGMVEFEISIENTAVIAAAVKCRKSAPPKKMRGITVSSQANAVVALHLSKRNWFIQPWQQAAIPKLILPWSFVESP